MESKANYKLIGIFFILLFGLFLSAIFVFGKLGLTDKYKLYRVLSSESVSGLNVGAPVRYRGVLVGSVDEINIYKPNSEFVEILIKIKADTPIKTDSVASLKPQGITGLSFIEISPGARESQLLIGDVPVIAFKESIFAGADDTITSIIKSMDAVLKKIDRVLDEKNERAVMRLIKESTTTVQIASKSIEKFTKIVEASEELPGESKKTLEALRGSADGISKLATSLDESVKRGDFEYKSELVEVKKEVISLLKELNKLAKNSNELVSEIRERPQSLIFGK